MFHTFLCCNKYKIGNAPTPQDKQDSGLRHMTETATRLKKEGVQVKAQKAGEGLAAQEQAEQLPSASQDQPPPPQLPGQPRWRPTEVQRCCLLKWPEEGLLLLRLPVTWRARGAPWRGALLCFCGGAQAACWGHGKAQPSQAQLKARKSGACLALPSQASQPGRERGGGLWAPPRFSSMEHLAHKQLVSSGGGNATKF